MADNGEKPSTSNGLGTDPQQRLATFKPPRDLTLGGAKPNKKVFTPNLNVARNKNKGPSSGTARDQQRDDKGRKDRRNNRARPNKHGFGVIKSTGVFSEGLGATERSSSRFSYGSRDAEPSATGALQKPTIRVKDVIKIDKELEEQKIRNVMGTAEADEPSEEEDFKGLDERDAPIKLPMDTGVWKTARTQVKQEIIVKAEPGEDGDCTMTSVSVPNVMNETFEDNDVVNLLKAEQPTLILLQLPDSLPGRGGAADPEPSTSSGEASEEAPPMDPRCRLSELEEGRIGSLRVHRSGRVTLALGDTVFEVSAGTKAAFHQEAVCVAADDERRAANLISLGPLQHKLNLTPDWQALFSDMLL